MVEIQLILYIVGAFFISILIGFLVSFIAFRLYKALIEKKELKGVPLDQSKFNDGYSIPINQKEVDKNEQDKYRRYREFEKLRQTALGRIPTNRDSPDTSGYIEEPSTLERRESIPIGDNKYDETNRNQSKGNERDLKERDKRFKWDPI
jgi:phosphate/sulfate permease